MNTSSSASPAVSGHGAGPGFRGSISGTLSSSSGGAVVDSGSLIGMVSRMGASRPVRGQAISRLLPPEQAHHVPIEFTGSGAEYFRIWIVNLLLVLVTLGIYYPWAKVRKLRYFHGNTSIAGHALDFHGEPRKMLRGSMLAGVLFALYSQALEYSAMAGLIGALIVSALWPVLLRSAMQFRLANTSWRGLRFAFAGDTAGAYKAVAVPLLLSLLPLALGAYAESDDARLAGDDVLQAIGLAWLVLAISLPYFYWRLKKYQHDHYRLGQLQTELRLDARSVYGVGLRALGLALLPPALAVGLAWLSMRAGGAAGTGGAGIAILLALLSFAWLIFLLGGLWISIVVMGYLRVRMQNLLWTKTGNRYMRFRSKLLLGPYLRLQLKNYLLLLLTLGLYWPWAAVATRRMQLEAVTLVTRIEIDDLVMAARPREGDAAADMGDDLLGFDLGL